MSNTDKLEFEQKADKLLHRVFEAQDESLRVKLSGGAISVNTSGSTSFAMINVTAITNSVQLSNLSAITAIIYNTSDTETIYVNSLSFSTGGLPISPGMAWVVPVDNLNKIFIRGNNVPVIVERRF